MAYTLQFEEILRLILLIVCIKEFESINIRLCFQVEHTVESQGKACPGRLVTGNEREGASGCWLGAVFSL